MAHKQINTFHLFAGAGGGILADLLLGHNPVGACEIEEYPRNVLLARQRDGIFPEFPIWDDICTLDGKPWRGLVDIVCGGFPCQDISAAGKGAGIAGERSGLWGEMARVIREIRPQFAFVENSPMLTSRGLHRVLGDLAEMGYDAKWCVLGACDAGAPHKRDRIWILAERKDVLSYSDQRRDGRGEQFAQGAEKATGELAESDRSRSHEDRSASELRPSRTEQSSENQRSARKTKGREVAGWWNTDPAEISYADLHDGCDVRGIELGEEKLSEPRESCEIHKPNDNGTKEEVSATKSIVGRVAYGVANRVDRLKAIGNGQVPQCAAMAFNILSRH